MTRRGRGEGTLSKRKDGRHQARVELPRDPVTGVRRRKTVYGHTRQAVVDELADLRGKQRGNELVATTTSPVGAFVHQWYARAVITTDGTPEAWSIGTKEAYSAAIANLIVPGLGKVKVGALTPAIVDAWVMGLVGVKGQRARAKRARAVLLQAMQHAVALRLIGFNPVAVLPGPSGKTTKPITILQVEQAQALLTVCEEALANGHPLAAAIIMALSLPLRHGEVAGMPWRHLDLDTRAMEVSQQLQVHKKQHGGVQIVDVKTAAAHRTLEMPTLLVDALRVHRRHQQAHRLRVGGKWKNPDGLVFTSPWGHAVPTLRFAFDALQARCDHRRVNFHVLKHTAISLLIAQGIELQDITKLAGHSRHQFTVDTYGHLVKRQTSRGAAAMDDILRGRG